MQNNCTAHTHLNFLFPEQKSHMQALRQQPSKFFWTLCNVKSHNETYGKHWSAQPGLFLLHYPAIHLWQGADHTVTSIWWMCIAIIKVWQPPPQQVLKATRGWSVPAFVNYILYRLNTEYRFEYRRPQRPSNSHESHLAVAKEMYFNPDITHHLVLFALVCKPHPKARSNNDLLSVY